MHTIPKEDRGRLQLLPIVTMWINHGTALSEQEIRMAGKLHPKEFEFAKNTPVADMFKMAEAYRDNRLYRDLIAIILSPKGRVWVERTVALCKKIEL